MQIISGISFNSEATFIRPADTTQYAANDAMGNSTTAAQINPLRFPVARVKYGTFGLQRVRLKSFTGTSLTAARFRLHLWTSLPIVANGDNAAMTVPSINTYIGNVDVTMDTVLVDGTHGSTNVAWIPRCFTNTKTIFGLMQALDVYTPISQERFAWILEGVVD